MDIVEEDEVVINRSKKQFLDKSKNLAKFRKMKNILWLKRNFLNKSKTLPKLTMSSDNLNNMLF